MNVNIFYPMLAMIGLTLIVGLVMLVSRIRAVKNRSVSPRYFVLVKGAEIPAHLEKLSNNFNNLFALPVLFYVLCITAYVVGKVDPVTILFAWVFFGSRVAHSIIHITYNNVIHRMLAFLCGLIVVLVMLIKLLLQL